MIMQEVLTIDKESDVCHPYTHYDCNNNLPLFQMAILPRFLERLALGGRS